MRPLRMLVAQAEAEEFGGKERHVGLDGPFAARSLRILGGIEPDPKGPPPPRLEFPPRVPAEAVEHALLVNRSIRDAVTVGVDLVANRRAPDREEGLPAQGEQRMEPAVRAVLVLRVETGQRAVQSIRSEPVGPGDPQLERARV